MTPTMSSGSLARLEEESLAQPWLATRLGIPGARVDALRRSGELFGVRPPGRWEHLYPAWQFTSSFKPLASLPRVLRAAREAGLDDVELYKLLSRRSGLTGRRTLVDVLREGGEDHVLRAVASSSRTR